MVLQKLLHWVLPLTCYHCQFDLPAGDGGPLCAACLQAVGPPEGLACRRCEVPLRYGGGHCWPCRTMLDKPRREHDALGRIRAASAYSAPARAVIRACKYKSRKHLAAPMAGWLYEAYLRHPPLRVPDALVPVPLHPARLRERGFNQSEELARLLGERLAVPMRDILSRVRATGPQAEQKSREDRRENVKDAFAAQTGAKLGGKDVLLIDDVATTGSTLEACAVALRRIGVRRIDALVVARQGQG